MTFTPWSGAPVLIASTGNAGYTLVNGTGAIPGLSWTAPSDGQPHRVILFGEIIVGTAETGGQIQAAMTSPAGNAETPAIFGSNLSQGFHGIQNNTFLVQAGSTFAVSQSAALTVGAAVAFLELWAS